MISEISIGMNRFWVDSPPTQYVSGNKGLTVAWYTVITTKLCPLRPAGMHFYVLRILVSCFGIEFFFQAFIRETDHEITAEKLLNCNDFKSFFLGAATCRTIEVYFCPRFFFAFFKLLYNLVQTCNEKRNFSLHNNTIQSHEIQGGWLKSFAHGVNVFVN